MYMIRMSITTKLVSLLFLVLLISSSTYAKERARLFIKTTNIDLGEIQQDNAVRVFNVVITNKGNADLIINNVQPDCDCTTTSFERRLVLKPKTTCVIKVTVNLTGFLPVDIEKEIAIYSNSKQSPEIIHVKGKIVYKEKENKK